MNNIEVFDNMKIKDLRKLTDDYLKLPDNLLPKITLCMEDNNPTAEEIVEELKNE